MQAATVSPLNPPAAGVAVNGTSSSASASNPPVLSVNHEEPPSDDDDQWENNSLYEEILTEADEAYKYRPGKFK